MNTILKISVLLLMSLFIISQKQEDKSIQESAILKFREMKMIIYGTTKGSNIVDCQYHLEIFINESKICVTPIPVLEQQFRVDEFFGDYMDEKELYKANLRLKINFFDTHNDENTRINVFDQVLNLFPDDQQKFAALENDKFTIQGVIFKLACYNYTGFNCQYDYIEMGKLHTDFNTGEQVCKTAKDCIEDDANCDPGDRECKNGGTCFKSNVNFDTYCVCASGYTGLNCEYEECVFNDEEFMYADRTQFCPATDCDEDDFCENEGISIKNNIGKCKMYGTYKYCTCDNSTYAGRKCQHKCDPSCRISHCTYDSEGPYCYLSNEYEDKIKQSNTSPLIYNLNSKKRVYAIFLAFTFVSAMSVFLVEKFYRKKVLFIDAVNCLSKTKILNNAKKYAKFSTLANHRPKKNIVA